MALPVKRRKGTTPNVWARPPGSPPAQIVVPMASMLREPNAARTLALPLTVSTGVQVLPLSAERRRPLVERRIKSSAPLETMDCPVPTLGATGRLAVTSCQVCAAKVVVSNPTRRAEVDSRIKRLRRRGQWQLPFW